MTVLSIVRYTLRHPVGIVYPMNRMVEIEGQIIVKHSDLKKREGVFIFCLTLISLKI